MEKIYHYDIPFASLKTGEHTYTFDITDSFFNLFKEIELEFDNTNATATVLLTKHSSFLELEMKIEGSVNVPCDISGDIFAQSISKEIKTLVKFGEEFDESNEEILILPLGENIINVAQLVYETLLLAIPMKRVHPRYLEGTEDKHTSLLESLSPEGDFDENSELLEE